MTYYDLQMLYDAYDDLQITYYDCDCIVVTFR